MAIKLGDINFGLGADTAALQRSMDKLVQFGGVVDTVSRRQSEGAAKVAAAYRAQEAAVVSALTKTANLTASIRRTGADSKLIDQTTAAFQRYTNYVTGGQRSALQMQRANERLGASLRTVNTELSNFRADKAAAQTTSMVNSLRNLATSSTLALGPLGGIASRISAFATIIDRTDRSTAIFVAGMAGAAVAAVKLGAAMVDASVKMNGIRMQLTAVTGSTSLAKAALEDVTRIAKLSGQEIAGTANSYAKFMAAANSTSLAGQKASSIFETVAMTAGKMNLTTDDAAGIFKALEQMMSKGTIQAEELRGQLGDRLPGAFNLMAQAMGVSTVELGKMMKNGELLSEEALPKLADQLKKTFNIDGTGITTYPAAVNNLTSSTTLFLDALDQEIGLSEALKASFNGLSSVMDFLRANVQNLWALFGALAGALIALNIGAVIAGFARLAATIRTAAAAMAALNTAVLLNPLGGLATILVRLITLIAGATAGWLGMKQVMGGSDFSSASQELDNLTESLYSAAGGMDYLANKARDSVTSQMFERQEKMIKLNDEINKSKVSYDFETGMKRDPSVKLKEELATLEKLQAADAARMRANKSAMEVNRAKVSAPVVPTLGNPQTAKQIEDAEDAMKRFNNELEDYRNKNAALATMDPGFVEAANNLGEYNEKLQRYKQLLDKTTLSEEDRARALEAIGAAMEQNTVLEAEYKRVQETVKELNDSMDSAFDSISDSIGDMVSKGEFDMNKLSDVFRSAAADILSTLFKIVVMNPLKEGLFGSAGGGGSGGGGLFGNILGSIGSSIFGGFDLGSIFGGGSGGIGFDTFADNAFMGAYAGGGSTKAGGMYMVGENGPEMWSEGKDGHITSNNALRQMLGEGEGDNTGGITVVQHYNISTGVNETVRAELDQMMPGIIANTKSAVVDARLRGGSFANTFRRS